MDTLERIENASDILDELEGSVWLTVCEAAEYASMSESNIYHAMNKGLPFRLNTSGIREINKDELELWFCPFRQSVGFYRAIKKEKTDRQQVRVQSLLKQNRVLRGNNKDLRKANEDLRDANEDLREENRRLEQELDRVHKRECKILRLIEVLKGI